MFPSIHFRKAGLFSFYCLFSYDNMTISSLKTTIVAKSQRALSALRDKINQMAAM